MVTGGCGAATAVRCGSVAFADCGNQDDTMAKCIAPVTGTSIPMIQGHRHRCLAPVDSPDTAMGGSLRLHLDDLDRLSLISPRRGGRHRKGKRNRARTNQLTKTAPSPSLPPSLPCWLLGSRRADRPRENDRLPCDSDGHLHRSYSRRAEHKRGITPPGKEACCLLGL